MSARESGESFWGVLTRELIVVSMKQVGTMRNDVVEQRGNGIFRHRQKDA